jgi:hypothetical protein
MLDMEALDRALAPLEDVGKGEITFTIAGHTLAVRSLEPWEEVAVQKYGQTLIDAATDEDGNVDNHVAMNYFDTIRIETLAYALVQINDLDLRDVDYVATGQQTDSGKAVRVRKNVAVREMIKTRKTWSRAVMHGAFAKYGELMTRIEQETTNIVEYEPSDLQAELERARAYVAELEAEAERRAKGDVNIMAEKVKAINAYDANQREAVAAAARTPARPEPAPPPEPEPPAPEPEPEPEPPPPEPEEEWEDFEEVPSQADLAPAPQPPPPVPAQEPVPRRPVSPTAAPPPGGGPVPPPPPAPPQEAPDLLPGVDSSFQDADDPMALQQEARRIAAARQRMAHERASGRGAPPVRRPPPPHRRGTRMGQEQEEVVDPQYVGQHKGAPVFDTPPQELSGRGRRPPPQGAPERPAVNQRGDGSKARNPNFRAPKG